ncbi:MAG: ATP-binding protein [Polyangiales bacterium]
MEALTVTHAPTPRSVRDEMVGAYLAVLREHLGGTGETALCDAYELGRKAIDSGLGVVDITSIHHEALFLALGGVASVEDGARAVRSAAQVEAESLSVFEMALRGYRSVNVELSRSNDDLKALTTELEAVIADERKARSELQQAHRELQVTQGQLVQSARLAALGQLVAGVAHEVNNPLAFVVNNNAVLRRDVQALCELVRHYQAEDDALAAHRPEAHARIQELAESIDLPYVLGNIEQLIARSGDGLKRIQQIVQDLRNFARADESRSVAVADLAESIESTVNIVRGQARDRGVELVTALQPLPPIVCVPSKVNQVVLNLLSNAIDACRDGDRVTLRTAIDGDDVLLCVEDTGEGIAPEVRDRIFDPFFTTKPQGQGTGLGLSISHGIVAEHHGRIEVESAPGRGTRFTVRLPLASQEEPEGDTVGDGTQRPPR